MSAIVLVPRFPGYVCVRGIGVFRYTGGSGIIRPFWGDFGLFIALGVGQLMISLVEMVKLCDFGSVEKMGLEDGEK